MNRDTTTSGFSTSDVLELGKGLLFGDDSGFSYNFRSLVRAAGVTHLVAASGANLGFVLILPGMLAKRQSWWLWQILAPGVLLVYWRLAESAPSLWRAMVMWGIYWCASWRGYRLSFSRVVLILTVILLIFGYDYWTAPGYWLSFWAVLGLRFSQSIMPGENNTMFLSQWQKRRNKARRQLLIGSGVWLAVSPWIWWWWQQVSYLGIWATWLIDPWLPLYQWASLAYLTLVSPLEKLFFPVLEALFSVITFILQIMVSISASQMVRVATQLMTILLLISYQRLVKQWWSQKRQLAIWRRRLWPVTVFQQNMPQSHQRPVLRL